MTAHARKRAADARRRIQRALRAKNVPININAVAAKAGVSRKTIYNNPDLCDAIRAYSRAVPAAEPATGAETSIVTALRHQLTVKDSEIADLKAQLRRRDDTIARLHGVLHDQHIDPGPAPHA
ncbi:hypothetical protein [Tomitella gaofuii]|uniref:hypothetical protein n=1 Tax=Tomitella gaofuii TaxID=2760083 RepID=UPI001F2FC7EC|nr:hypothetical protein [Tomitella gaofuii]